ncbi:hypothetical protein NBM05_07485 [Rothia sp. AR01]|uniref:Uncharacterized protein n=1 Tax=Rothia santali TaxID=2949643 RepID=A0A9X2HFK8_9MICC|nr:hypothetical protein [Rothia santali]MCP3425852.1 hypothetical protein [Rothia santali]
MVGEGALGRSIPASAGSLMSWECSAFSSATAVCALPAQNSAAAGVGALLASRAIARE